MVGTLMGPYMVGAMVDTHRLVQEVTTIGPNLVVE